jgi:hypothetical protein
MTEHDRERESRWGQGDQGGSRGYGEGERDWEAERQRGSGANRPGQQHPQHPQYPQRQGGYGQHSPGRYGSNTGAQWGGTGGSYGQGGLGGSYGSGHPDQGAGWMGHGQHGQGWYGGGQPQGGSRGKPPKGYQRSDERLREMICERLMEDGRIDASDVEIEVQGGRVTLAGSVDSRMSKYQIEDMIEQFGVGDVQNNLRIARAGEGGAQASPFPSPGAGSSQQHSSGGASSLGLSASGSLGDRTTGSSGTGSPASGGTNQGSKSNQ